MRFFLDQTLTNMVASAQGTDALCLGLGGWVGVLDWKAISWAFTHTRRPTLGAWVLCWWGTWIHTDTASPGVFSYSGLTRNAVQGKTLPFLPA